MISLSRLRAELRLAAIAAGLVPLSPRVSQQIEFLDHHISTATAAK